MPNQNEPRSHPLYDCVALRAEWVAQVHLVVSLVYANFTSQVHRSLPQLEANVAAAKEARDELKIEDESLVASYMALLQSLSQLRHQLRSAAQNPNKALPFLQPGGHLTCVAMPARLLVWWIVSTTRTSVLGRTMLLTTECNLVERQTFSTVMYDRDPGLATNVS